MTRMIVVDTETTGIGAGHRIIEIGCRELINRKLGETFHVYLNPDRSIDEGAFKVHGISEAFLSDKPRFSDIVHEWVEFIQASPLIIHNAPFDLGFLRQELALCKHPFDIDSLVVIDTLPMARKQNPGQRNSLDALCKRHGIDNTHRTLHGALLDAEILAEVYLAMTGGQSNLFSQE